jgi:hypothetical protein
MDERGLREKVREVIQAGTLPDRDADRTWGGPGSGLDCVVCGQTLHPVESELELEFFLEGAERAPTVRHLHGGCFLAWEAERRQKSAPSHGGDGRGLPPEVDRGTIGDRERTAPNNRERP